MPIVETHQPNHLHSTLVKLILHPRKGAQFGRTDGGEVGRVGKEDGPAVSDELVEINLAFGGQGFEIGG